MTTSVVSAEAAAAALRIVCPNCGRSAGRACVTAGGAPARRSHAERLRRAPAEVGPVPEPLAAR